MLIKVLSRVSLFLVAVILCQSAYAEKVLGIGISQSSMGVEHNTTIATAQARNFIAEQTRLSYFVFYKKNKSYKIKKILEADIGKIKLKKRYNFGKRGVAVISEANMKRVELPDSHCHKTSSIIKTSLESNQLLENMLKKSIVKLIAAHHKNKTRVTGVSYIKSLKIKKLRKRRFKVSASICIADDK